MTNEEAIEILEERWRYSKTYKYTDAEIREAFDTTIKALEQTRWIQVTERLPKNNNEVLVTDGDNYFLAWYEGNDAMSYGWHSYDVSIYEYNPIIAWKPIEPYTEVKADDES